VFFHFTIFLSALLLFQVQLLMGKFLLPWFGGTAATWTVCLLYFQGILLAGYLHVHGMTSDVSLRTQRRIHACMLGASVVALAVFAWISGGPLLPNASWRSEVNAFPALHIVGLLTATVGFPCLILSTTSPLLQRWYAILPGTGSPYKLYALSNAGSLIGLISYPLLLEPMLTLKQQASLWVALYAFFVLGVMGCLLQVRRAAPAVPEPVQAAARRDRAGLWFFLSACGAVMLYATTNMVCLDVAAVPMLWVVPLVVYLATFILCFEGGGGYRRAWGIPLFGVATVTACCVLYLSTTVSVPLQVLSYGFVLFASCTVCHGELYALKPGPERLTRFYLTIAAGGVFGGALVAIVAPLVLKSYWEFHAGLWMCWFLLMIALARDRESAFYRGNALVPYILIGALVIFLAFIQSPLWTDLMDSVPPWIMLVHYGVAGVAAVALCVWIARRPPTSRFHKQRAGWVRNAMVVMLVALQLTLMIHVQMFLTNIIHVTRNFYGTLRVAEDHIEDPARHRFSLHHGRIKHGSQLVASELRAMATTYYGENSGIGLALLHNPRRAEGKPLRIGVVGLGVGTIATYARPGDEIRFYEINPAVPRIAGKSPWFTYLGDCVGSVDIVEGDGRIALERECRIRAPLFDILVLDAFSGDAVPMHLLTLQAFEIYFQRLRQPGGLVAVNVSNRYLDLKPVIAGAARALGRPVVTVEFTTEDERLASSTWMLLSAGDPFAAEIEAAKRPEASDGGRIVEWTDDFSNLLGVIK